MRFLLTLFCLSLAFCTLEAKELKVLMIGNSFSTSVTKFLPQVVNSVPGHTLQLTSAYIGGCQLERHYNNLLKSEKDPQFHPYEITTFDSAKTPHKQNHRKGSINELLKNNQYDIITLQQGSIKSFLAESYEPYTTELIKYIRKYQKNAEIVIQQTWAYRYDSARFAKWSMTQDQMYEQLNQAYKKAAAAHHLRMIPMGDAVQLYRQLTPQKYQRPQPPLVYPQRDSNAGDPVGRSAWRTNKKTGERYKNYDCHHLNRNGEYMQALLWFAFLYNEPVSKAAYRPVKMEDQEIQLLKKCAQTALDNLSKMR